MQIGIIGGGAIGLLFASYLHNDFSVTLYTRTSEQAVELNKYGLILQRDSKKVISMVKALPISDWEGVEELSIIAVKQYQLPAIFDRITKIQVVPKNLLFLQNGMGHLELLEKLPVENIYVGTVEHGALKINSYTVSHNGEGMTNVAVYRGNPLVIQEFSSMTPPIFPVTLLPDFYMMLVNKLIVNAVINPLTAILNVKNGELVENSFYYKAAKILFDEVAAILNLGEADQHFQRIMDVCEQTASNRSSMLKDTEDGRRTEVDAILGYLLKEAARQKKMAPQIASYYYLLKGKEFAWEGIS